MQHVRTYVDGNLALSPAVETVSFTVIDGGKRDAAVEASSQRRRGVRDLLIAACLFLLPALVAFAMVHAQNETYTQALETTPLTSVDVEAGDTLWAIAETHPVDGLSTSDTVSLIRKWNDLDSAELAVGSTLQVADSSR